MKVLRSVGTKKSRHSDYCKGCNTGISVIDRVLHNGLCYMCWSKELKEDE